MLFGCHLVLLLLLLLLGGFIFELVLPKYKNRLNNNNKLLHGACIYWPGLQPARLLHILNICKIATLRDSNAKMSVWQNATHY